MFQQAGGDDNHTKLRGVARDLIDAYESEAELGLARVDLQWEARLAAIALDHSLGRGIPE